MAKLSKALEALEAVVYKPEVKVHFIVNQEPPEHPQHEIWVVFEV